MCISQRKLDVLVTKRTPFTDQKQWVMVTVKRSRTFYPSFRDIGRIVVQLQNASKTNIRMVAALKW